MSDKTKTIPFGKLPSWIILDGLLPQFKHSDLKVFCVLISHAGVDGKAWPGIRRIAKLTGLSNGTAGQATERLAKIGVIKITKKGCGRGNLYEISQPPSALAQQGACEHGSALIPDMEAPCCSNLKRPAGAGHSAPTQQGATRSEQNKETEEETEAADVAAASIIFNSKRDNEEKRQCLEQLGLSSAGYLLKEMGEVPPDQFKEVVKNCLSMGDAFDAPVGVMVNAIKSNWRDALERLNELGRREVIQSELEKTSASQKAESMETESARVKAFMEKALGPVTDELLGMFDNGRREYITNLARKKCGNYGCLFQRVLFDEFHSHFAFHGLDKDRVFEIIDKHEINTSETTEVRRRFLEEFSYPKLTPADEFWGTKPKGDQQQVYIPGKRRPKGGRARTCAEKGWA